MGVSKNRGGPPKWMVNIMENPIKMDDLGVPLFLETPMYNSSFFFTLIPLTFKIRNHPTSPSTWTDPLYPATNDLMDRAMTRLQGKLKEDLGSVPQMHETRRVRILQT